MKKHTFRKILVTLLVLAMVVPCLPVIATAEDAAVEYTYAELKDLVTADDVTDWLATEKGNVLEISSLEDLACFLQNAKWLGGKTVELTTDIVVNDGTASINGFVPKTGTTIYSWTQYAMFKGVFDGKGHSISGLYQDETRWTGHGFFNAVEGATIKDVKFVNSYFGSTSGGAVNCGVVAGKASKGSKFENITVEAYQNYASNKDTSYIGGICGLADSGQDDDICTFTNCVVKGEINAPKAYGVGGLLGVNKSHVSITGVDVDCKISARERVGGILGSQDLDLARTNVTIFDSSVSGEIVVSDGAAGGFVGMTRNNIVTITNGNCDVNMTCTGNVTRYIGGYVGLVTKDLTLNSCYFSGQITFTGSGITPRYSNLHGAFACLFRCNKGIRYYDRAKSESEGRGTVVLNDCVFDEGSVLYAVGLQTDTPWYDVTVSYTELGSELTYDCSKSSSTAAADLTEMFMTVPAQKQDKFEILGFQISKPDADGTVDVRLVAGLDLGDTALEDIGGIGFEFAGVNNKETGKSFKKSSTFIYEKINTDFGKASVTAKELGVDYLAVVVIEDISEETLDYLVFRTYCDIGDGNAYSDYYYANFTDGAFNKDQSCWLEIAG